MVSTVKKVGALFAMLAIALVCLAGSATNQAWAADNYSKDVKFEGVASGDTVNAYKLVSYDNGYNDYSVDSKFREFLKSNSNPYYGQLSSNPTDKELVSFLSGRSAEEVRNLLNAYQTDWGNYPPNNFASAGGPSASISFEPGYYMVTISTTAGNARVYNPIALFVKVEGNKSVIYTGNDQTPSADDSVTIQAKSVAGPQIEKYVKRANGTLHKTQTVESGETVTYAIKVTLPDYTGSYVPVMNLHDNATGLTYKDDTAKVYKANSAGDNYDENQEVTGAIESISSANDGGVAFKLDYSKLGNGGTFYVVYEATVDIALTQNATNKKFEGKNTAYMTYNTSVGGNTAATEKSSTSVYTYALRLSKLDQDNASLTGAKYTFYEGSGKVKFTKEGSYYVVDPSGSVTEIAADGFEDDNALEIRGIDASKTYQIEESTVPNGYYAPAGKYTLALGSLKQSGDGNEHTGNIDNGSYLTGDQEDMKLVARQAADGATYNVQLKNSTTPALPSTGGMGTIVLTIAGVVLMVVAGAFFVIRRRRAQH